MLIRHPNTCGRRRKDHKNKGQLCANQHVYYACLELCLNSVLNVKALVGAFTGEGVSRGLLRDYEPSDGPSFEALVLNVA